ncbi:MAG: diaminopimelate epimerase [Ignavibacteriales bacterium]|nr:MAG: diaminopimelate epimerase [Ignavibacteriales bacterium]
MNNFNFTKMSGAGNDFILFDKNINPGLALNPNSIKKLCDRRNGIGADGIITVSDGDNCDFEMEYFNADGSTGSLCGNGSRCAIKFAEVTGRLKNGSANFISNKKSYKGKIIDEKKITFFLNQPEDLKLNFDIFVLGQLINLDYINTGSPHVVINIGKVLKDISGTDSEYKNINEFPVNEFGSEIRYHEEFAPEGTNVNFISLDNEKVLIRTYERGVEDETLSCGTGNVAAAIIASINFGVNSPVNLLTRGGDILTVDFEKTGNSFKNVALTGPVKTIYTGEINSIIFDK